MLEVYAKEKEMKIQEIKKIAKDKLETGELKEEGLIFLIEQAYSIGHYAGHCRGEKHVREVYGLE